MGRKYIVRRGNTLHFQKAVPTDLHERVGKKVWKHALKTQDTRVAERRANTLERHYLEKIEQLRALTPDRMDQLTELLSTAGLDVSNGQWNVETLDQALSVIAQKRREIADGMAPRYESLSDQIGSEATDHILDDKTNPLFRGDWARLAAADSLAAAVAGFRGEITGDGVRGDPAPAPRLLGGVWASVDHWKRTNKPSPATQSECDLAARRLVELIGDKPIREYTVNEVQEFRDALLATPVRAPKAQADLPFPELIDYGKRNNLDKISPVTARKQLGLLRSVFSTCLNEGEPSAFFQIGIKNNKSVRKKRSRFPFTPDDFAAIFSTPLMTGEEDNAPLFWGVLLLAFTGARLGELCLLEPADLKQHSKGVWYLNLIDDPEGGTKTLKNEDSRRNVPVHPHLVRMGFIGWALGQTGTILGFPRDAKGRPSGTASKRIAYWMRKRVGILDKRKAPSHSFRHSFKDIARDNGVEEAIIDAIQGHASESEGRKYGLGYGIPTLHAAMANIRLPVDVSHLFKVGSGC